MAAKKRVVIFDFDGVVADSFALHLACWRAVLTNHRGTLEDSAIEKSIGWNTLDTARALLREAGIAAEPAALAEEKDELFTSRSTELKPMSGVVEAIKRLNDQYFVAVAGGQDKAPVTAALNQFGLADQLQTVVTLDDLTPGDELEALLKVVLAKCELTPAAGVMIDDSRNGLLAAERAGMKSVAFDSNPSFEIDFSMADAVVGSLDELQPELLDSVFS